MPGRRFFRGNHPCRLRPGPQGMKMEGAVRLFGIQEFPTFTRPHPTVDTGFRRQDDQVDDRFRFLGCARNDIFGDLDDVGRS